MNDVMIDAGSVPVVALCEIAEQAFERFSRTLPWSWCHDLDRVSASVTWAREWSRRQGRPPSPLKAWAASGGREDG